MFAIEYMYVHAMDYVTNKHSLGHLALTRLNKGDSCQRE